MAHDKLLKKLNSLYLQGLSGVRVAEMLQIPYRQVYRLMETNGIERRTAQETNRIRYLKQKPSFTIKKGIRKSDTSLLTAGVMLYWAEGAKYKNKNTIDFANSNPEMISIFIKFLRDICGIQEKKLRIYLYCYANQDIRKLKAFWSKVTRVRLEQFTKPYVREDFREDKKGKMPWGLIHVRYFDKKLYIQFEEWYSGLLKEIIGGVAE